VIRIIKHPGIYDEKAFSQDIVGKWGDISSSLVDDQGLLHVQMSHLGKLVKDSFSEGDGALGQEILEFLGDILTRKDMISEFENAIVISFLGYEELNELGILDQLPPAILKVIRESHW